MLCVAHLLVRTSGKAVTPKQMRVYGELFKILQEKPKYVAQLAHELSISEIDGEWQLRYQGQHCCSHL